MASFITTMLVALPFTKSSVHAPALLPVCSFGRSDASSSPTLLHTSLEVVPTLSALKEEDAWEVDCLRIGSYRNARTRGQFKPRNVNKGTSSYQLRQFAEATLGSGSLRKAVKLPDGEDLNEWLAVNGMPEA